MSGPKIVKIVTRDEVIVMCRGLLAQLDDAIETWRRTGERRDLIDQQDITRVLSRRDQIFKLLERGRFPDLQKQVPQEITFLQTDIERRLDKKAAVETDNRTGRRRLANAAASLLASLESVRVELHPDLRRALNDARANAKGGTEAAKGAISEGLTLLVPEKPEGALTERQRALACRLGEGETTTALSEWLAGQPPPDDDVGQKFDAYIARLEAAEGAEAAAPYVVRAEAIVAEPSASRRRMLADSLILELAKEAAVRKERAQILAALSALGAEVAGFGSRGGAALVARIETVKRIGNARAAEPLIEEARTLVESERRSVAAGARRRAVLTALSQLGYEVREGMETAWVESNRVVLKKTAAPDYGLELSGKAETGRLQFRVVGVSTPSQPRSPARDKDMEVIWCSEIEELKLLLAEAGGELAVERAVPAGEQPVKEVAVPAWATGESQDNVTPSSAARNAP